MTSQKIFQAYFFAICGITFAIPAIAQNTSRVNLYTASAFQATWTDIATIGDTFHYNHGDLGYGEVTLPFDFPYDDSVISAGSKIRIGAAGVISLLPDTIPSASALGNSTFPGLLCVFSANLVAGKGMGADSDYYELSGSAPNRIFTIEYHFEHIPGTGSGGGGGGGGGGGKGGNAEMMQVKMYETSGIIEFIYQNHNSLLEGAGDSASLGAIGLNGLSTPSFVSDIYRAELTASPSTDIRFTPGNSSGSARDSVFLSMPFSSGSCTPDTATVTVKNLGTVPETYLAFLSGANVADFKFLSRFVSDSIPPGGSANFTITFLPSKIGQENANIVIAGGTGGSMNLNVAGTGATISGTGTAKNTAVGSIDTFAVPIQNSGTCPWTPNSPVVNAPFEYLSGAFTVIPAGGMGALLFTFKPDSVGDYSSPVLFPNGEGITIPAPSVILSGSAVNAAVAMGSEMAGYAVSESYPNPSHGQTALQITMAQREEARIDLLNTDGTVMETLLDRALDAGQYSASFDLSNLPAGTYYCRLKTGVITLMRNLVIEK